MNRSQRNIILHVLGCILFMSQPILFPTHPPEEKNWLYSLGTRRDFIANAVVLVFFYANYYSFIPKLYFNKKYIAYCCCLLLGLLAVSYIPSLLTGRDFINHPEHLQRQGPPLPPPEMDMHFHQTGLGALWEELSHHIFLFVAMCCFSLLLRIRNRWFITEKARQDAEIAYLTSQINPHFLFNALNSIYALTVKEKATASSEGMLKLSGMMRYLITDATRENVPLEHELFYIDDYIELQKLRLASNIKLYYKRSGEPAGKTIAPLILICFIENAFKHGVNPDENSEISIDINVAADALILDVLNNKVKTDPDAGERSGIGIQNARNRLDLLYPGRHHFHVNETPQLYHVILKIFL